MKFVYTSLLTVLLVLLLVTGTALSIVRFRILNPDFWKTSFSNNNVYSDLTLVLQDSINTQIEGQVTNKNDSEILTDLVTVGNVTDFLNKNVEHTIGYFNGKESEFLVYIPVSKIPTSILPQSFIDTPDQVPIMTLLTSLRINGVRPTLIQNLGVLGYVVTGALVLTIAIAFLVVYGLYKLTAEGGRLVSLSVAFIISGFMNMIFYQAFRLFKHNLDFNFSERHLVGEVLATVTSPAIDGFSSTWLFVGIGFVILGLALLFFKKRTGMHFGAN